MLPLATFGPRVNGVPRLASPVQQRFRQYAPLVISVVIVVLFGLYLAVQANDWLRPTRAPTETLPSSEPATGSTPDPARIELLFGTPVSSPADASQATSSNLTLLGSFVHSDPAKSTAIIQVGGNPPKLYRIEDELEPGVQLQGVHADRIDVQRGDTLESLFFPTERSQTMAEQQMPVYEAPAPAAMQPDPEQLRLQLEMLRQQIEETAAPSDEQPTEDD